MDRSRRLGAVAKVLGLVAVAYVAIPPILFSVWAALENLVTLSWTGTAIWLPIAATGVASAILALRGWGRYRRLTIVALLPLLAWMVTMYVLLWILVVWF